MEDNGDGTYTCTYKPNRPGTYIVKVSYDKIPVPKCPVKVTVSTSADLSKIKAWGPGLEKGNPDVDLCSFSLFWYSYIDIYLMNILNFLKLNSNLIRNASKKIL